MQFHKAALALGLLLASAMPASAVEAVPGLPVTSLDQAIRIALARSPVLDINRAQLGSGQGDLVQAGLLPNPTLSLEMENIAGSSDYRGLRSAEITYGLNQQIELGGKRTARVQVAQAGLDLTQQEGEVARLDLIREVTRAYTELAASSYSVALEEERARLAGELLRVAQGRVEAGKEPLIQRRKAEVALSTARIAISKARRDFDSARRELLTLMGSPAAAVVPDQTWFETLDLPAPIAADGGLDRSPDYRRWDAAIARSRAELNAAEAKAYPDITLGAGVRQFRESDDTAFVVGVSVPLPIFDRNQGNRLKAMSDIARVEAEARQSRLALTTMLTDAQAKLAAAHDEAALLRSEALPSAEQAFSFAREGYQAGKFSFLEVLDAQRALFDVKEQLNAALREFHLRQAALGRLTGQAIADAGGTP